MVNSPPLTTNPLQSALPAIIRGQGSQGRASAPAWLCKGGQRCQHSRQSTKGLLHGRAKSLPPNRRRSAARTSHRDWRRRADSRTEYTYITPTPQPPHRRATRPMLSKLATVAIAFILLSTVAIGIVSASPNEQAGVKSASLDFHIAVITDATNKGVFTDVLHDVAGRLFHRKSDSSTYRRNPPHR